MSTEQERAEFEAEIRENWGFAKLERVGGDYIDPETQGLWELWNARAVLQSPEIQALYGLLKESRHQLPLAAQFWNEDDDSERGRRNLRHVLGLIARVDAAMERQL